MHGIRGRHFLALPFGSLSLAIGVPVLVIGGGLFGSALLASTVVQQQPTVVRAASVGPTRILVSSQCTTVGRGNDGRADGLHQIAGGRLTSDGSLVLLNGGTREILRFSAEGRLVDAVKHEGQGPGEFSVTRTNGSGFRMVPYRGDSVAVYQAMRTQLSIFDQSGRFGRTMRLDESGSRAHIVGTTQDGDFVFAQSGPASPPTDLSTPGIRYIKIPRLAMRLSASGTLLSRTEMLEGYTNETRVLDGSGTFTTANGVRHSLRLGPAETLPTSRMIGTAVADQHAHHYVESTNELHSYDQEARLVRRVLLPAMPVPRPLNTAGPSGKQQLSIASDALGRVWLQVPRSDAGSERHWWVINRSGQVEATAVVPAGSPLYIGADKIALWNFDADGVEIVNVCSMVTSKTPGVEYLQKHVSR